MYVKPQKPKRPKTPFDFRKKKKRKIHTQNLKNTNTQLQFQVLGCDLKRLGLDPIPGSSRNDLARSHVKLTRTVSHRRTIIVHVTNNTATAIANDLGPFPLNAPVVESLEKGSDLVLFLEPELGRVDPWEGKCAFVPGLEVKVWWVEVGWAQIEVCPTFRAAVDGSHWLVFDGFRNCCCCLSLRTKGWEGGL